LDTIIAKNWIGTGRIFVSFNDIRVYQTAPQRGNLKISYFYFKGGRSAELGDLIWIISYKGVDPVGVG